MQLIYAQEPFPKRIFKSIFLAGPTPGSKDVPSWRPEALRILKEKGFDGTVFIPEPRDGSFGGQYDEQGQWNWEIKCLNAADCILFWIPRDLVTLPGFTTNIEWGKYFGTGKCVLGTPENTPKMGYMLNDAKNNNVPAFLSLEDTISGAIEFIGEGSWREEGESFVPLYIWRTSQFQSWYGSLKSSGNYLLNAEIKFVHKSSNCKESVCCVVLGADIFAEGGRSNRSFIIINPDAILSSRLSPNKMFLEISKNSWPAW